MYSGSHDPAEKRILFFPFLGNFSAYSATTSLTKKTACCYYLCFRFWGFFFPIAGSKPCSLQGAEHDKTQIWNKVRITKIPAMSSGAVSLPWSAMHVFGMGNIQQADPGTALICGYQLP